MPSPSNARMRIRLTDERSYQRLKTILSYESSLRGRALGQTAFELVMEAVDLDSYPEEVKERIAELQDQTEKYAVERALKMSRGEE